MQVRIICATGYINGLIFLLIVFVDYKKGAIYWTKVAPNIYLGLIWMSYLVLPWFNLTFLLYTIYDGSLSYKMDLYNWELWCVGCNVIFICNFIEYIVLVHKTIVFQIRTYAKLRKEVEVYKGKESNEEIIDLIDEKVNNEIKLNKYLI